MRMMLAEDDPVFQRLLTKTLTKWGFEVLLARDGNQAWQIMQGEDAPRLAVMDWMTAGSAVWTGARPARI